VEVVLEEPQSMNLLGLFMKAALEDRRDRLEGAGASGDIALTGGNMSVTLSFDPDRVTVRKGVAGTPRAHLKGSLEGLLEVARGNTAAPLIGRRVSISGNPLAVLPLREIFKRA
jgi:SCP-2 sterol transfer family